MCSHRRRRRARCTARSRGAGSRCCGRRATYRTSSAPPRSTRWSASFSAVCSTVRFRAMSSSPTNAPSAAEQRASARIGALLFRNRSWLPVPFLVVALLAPAHPTLANWLAGAVLIVVGEWIRLAGVAAAGTVTRRRSRDVQRLVTYGIFRWVRNPLYVGNFLIWMGFVVISGVLWFLPIAVVLFAIEYALIVAY